MKGIVLAERIRMGVALEEVGRKRGPTSAGARGKDDAPTRAKLESFCRALAEATELPIVAYAAPRYDRLLHRLRAGEVELGWLAPLVALQALRAGVVPVALPLRGSAPWFWTALFARPDSRIESVADLGRARAVWVHRGSASGYLVIRAALRAGGLDVDGIFSNERFALSHAAVVREVLSDRDAVGATFVHLDADGKVERAGWGSERVRVLRTAGPIPSDVIAASSTLGAEPTSRVRQALVTGGSQELARATADLFSARGFAPAERAHLAHLEQLGRYLILS
jgi:phosphonate transport system substrate-binding protein